MRRDIAAYSGRQGNLVQKALVLLALIFVRPGTVAEPLATRCAGPGAFSLRLFRETFAMAAHNQKRLFV